MKDISFDLVKTKCDWIGIDVKPVISGSRLAVQAVNPPAFIEREKKKFYFSSFKFSFMFKSFVLTQTTHLFWKETYKDIIQSNTNARQRPDYFIFHWTYVYHLTIFRSYDELQCIISFLLK